MRLLVEGRSLGPEDGRMRLAAGALAHRGHLVVWLGPGSPFAPGEEPRGFRALESALRLRGETLDVVLGGSRAARVALAGALARVHVQVLSLSIGAVGRWGLADRWAWNALHPAGLVEPAEAEEFRTRGGALGLDRLGLWPDGAPADSADPTHPDAEILERAAERSLARHRGRAPRPGAFLDRDGTLVVERGYLADPEEIELLPGVPAALHNLRAAGYALVVISNQSGVGRGLFPLSRVHEAMARLRRELRAHGVELDAIYFCPHRPEEGCACRKPGTLLLERAAEDLVLDLKTSVMTGDKLIDPETGQAAGGRGVLVRTGYGRDEERRLLGEGSGRAPDRVVDDLGEMARWVLGRGGLEDL